MQRALLMTLALLALATPSLAVAQTASPLPIPVPSVKGVDPGIVRAAQDIIQGVINQQQSISRNTARGEVAYFRRFDLQVIVGNNTYRAVHLHQGTEINPRGATIAQGQRVDVQGRGRSDGSLDADRITILQ